MPWSMSVGGQVPWVLDGASVVGQDVGAGGCGGVVGVGVVDLDVVDGGGLAGGGNGVDGDGVPVVVAQAVSGLDVSGGGEALAVDVQGVGWCGLQVAVAGADPDGGRVLVGEGPGDRGGGGLAGVGVGAGDVVADGHVLDGLGVPAGKHGSRPTEETAPTPAPMVPPMAAPRPVAPRRPLTVWGPGPSM